MSGRDHIRGGPSTAITLVEFGDFDCPFCVGVYPVLRSVEQRFGPELCLVFRHNPLGELHEHALLAAQAAEAASLQGRFWEMHDRLFERRNGLDESALLTSAVALGLERARFQRDLHSKEVRARVREDEKSGLRSGVVGTPTLFIDGAHFWDTPDFPRLVRAIEGRLAHRARARAG